MNLEFELFKGKTLSGLLKDIYGNATKKDKQINLLIAELKDQIKTIQDSTMVVPLIAKYLEISVDNDDSLVKLAAIVQRMTAIDSKSGTQLPPEELLTEEEKKQLLAEMDSLVAANTKTNEKIISMASNSYKDLDNSLEQILKT